MTWRVLHGRWGATCAEKALCTWIANPVVVAMIPWMRAHGLGRDFLYVILAWPQGSSWTQTRLSDSAFCLLSATRFVSGITYHALVRHVM